MASDSKRLQRAKNQGWSVDITESAQEWVIAYDDVQSCMRGNGAVLHGILSPLGVKMAILRNQAGKIVARAQVRDNDHGRAYGEPWAILECWLKKDGYRKVAGVWSAAEVNVIDRHIIKTPGHEVEERKVEPLYRPGRYATTWRDCYDHRIGAEDSSVVLIRRLADRLSLYVGSACVVYLRIYMDDVIFTFQRLAQKGVKMVIDTAKANEIILNGFEVIPGEIVTKKRYIPPVVLSDNLKEFEAQPLIYSDLDGSRIEPYTVETVIGFRDFLHSQRMQKIKSNQQLLVEEIDAIF